MSQILVIDDDVAILELITLALDDEGYGVIPVHDAKEALNCLIYTIPNLIILDMLMPEMDGKTFVETYRNQGGQSPIIGLSASARFLKEPPIIGVDDFLAKPFDLDELLRCVEKYVEPAP